MDPAHKGASGGSLDKPDMTGVTMSEQPSKLQSIRVILEGVIVAALIWTGSSLIELKTQTAVVQSQLANIQTTLASVPDLKVENVKQRSDIEQLKSEVEDLKRLKGFK